MKIFDFTFSISSLHGEKFFQLGNMLGYALTSVTNLNLLFVSIRRENENA